MDGHAGEGAISKLAKTGLDALLPAAHRDGAGVLGVRAGCAASLATVPMDANNARIRGVGGAALGELERAVYEFVATDEIWGTVRRLKVSADA